MPFLRPQQILPPIGPYTTSLCHHRPDAPPPPESPPPKPPKPPPNPPPPRPPLIDPRRRKKRKGFLIKRITRKIMMMHLKMSERMETDGGLSPFLPDRQA